MLEQAFLRAPWQTAIAWWYAHELYLARDREMFKWVAYDLMLQIDEKKSRDELIAMLEDLGEKAPGNESRVGSPGTELLAHQIGSYRESAAYKAVALALDYRGRVAFGISSQSTSQSDANDEALRTCNKQLKNRVVRAKCHLYAEGKRVVANSATELML